jgi:hypothetical protein
MSSNSRHLEVRRKGAVVDLAVVVASRPLSAGNRFDRRPEPEYEDW